MNQMQLNSSHSFPFSNENASPDNRSNITKKRKYQEISSSNTEPSQVDEEINELTESPSKKSANKMPKDENDKKLHSIKKNEIQWKFDSKQMNIPFSENVPTFTPKWVMGILWNKYRKWKGVPKQMLYSSVTSSMKQNRDKEGHIILSRSNLESCLELMLASCPYIKLQLLHLKDKAIPESCISITKEGVQWCLKWLTSNKKVKGETDKQAEELGLLQLDEPESTETNIIQNISTDNNISNAPTSVISTNSSNQHQFQLFASVETEFWTNIQKVISSFNAIVESKRQLEQQMKELQTENEKLKIENTKLKNQLA